MLLTTLDRNTVIEEPASARVEAPSRVLEAASWGSETIANSTRMITMVPMTRASMRLASPFRDEP